MTHLRRALGVPPFNKAGLQLWSAWRPAKLPRPAAGPLVRFDPARLRGRRLALGLTMWDVAAGAGWWSPSTYDQFESCRRRVTRSTLRRMATALDCPHRALLRPPDGSAGPADGSPDGSG